MSDDAKLRSPHSPKLGFLEDFHAKFLCLVELAARFGTGEDVIGFFADAASDVTAERFDFFRSFLARHRGQRAGQNKRLSRQWQFGGFLRRYFFVLWLNPQLFHSP